MKHALFAILFFCPLFAFGDTNDEMAIRDLERAIQMTDATMEHSFSGSTSNMRMYDLYNQLLFVNKGQEFLSSYLFLLIFQNDI